MGRRKRQIVIITIVGVIALFFLWLVLFVPRPDFYYYNNSKARVKLKFPSSWTSKENLETGALVAFISPLDSGLDIYPDNVNIVIQDLSKNPLTLDEYAKLAVDQLIAVFGNEQIHDLKTESTQLAHLPAKKIVYTAKAQEADLKIMHILAVDGMTAYQFTYSALTATYDKYIGLVNTMAQSFEIY